MSQPFDIDAWTAKVRSGPPPQVSGAPVQPHLTESEPPVSNEPEFVPRYNEETGVYRDCPHCAGKGCDKCKEECDAEYNRQFPNGQKPLAIIRMSGGAILSVELP